MDDIEDFMDDTPLYDPDPDLLEVECSTCEGKGHYHDDGLWPCPDCDGTGVAQEGLWYDR